MNNEKKRKGVVVGFYVLDSKSILNENFVMPEKNLDA